MTDFTEHMKIREVKEIRQGDPKFMLNDGLIMYPRAMVHVLPECPANIRDYIQWAISEGYLKTVAYVYGKELMLDSLRD